MISIIYTFLHLIVWMFFSFISLALIKDSKFKINFINLPVIIMVLTLLLLLTKFSLMGGIFAKIYFGLGFFISCLEMIAVNAQIDEIDKIKGFEKVEITFSQKLVQFLMVLFFIPQHLLLISCWFIYHTYGSNEKLKS